MARIKILFSQSIAIVICSAIIGIIFNWASFNQIPFIAAKPIPLKDDPRIISLEDAKKVFDETGPVFIDARKQRDYANGHVPGALNFYAEEFGTEEEESITELLPFDTLIIAYCDGGECELSRRLAERLEEIGYARIRILVAGWDGWKNAGYPVETTMQK